MNKKMFAGILILFAVIVLAGCNDSSSSSNSLMEEGVLKWTENSVPVCTGGWDVREEKVCYNGFGQSMVAWSDLRAGSGNFDIYIQTLDSSGKALWPSNGNPVCTAVGGQRNLAMTADGLYGGVNLVWIDDRNGVDSDIYAQQIGLGGDQVWKINGVAICKAAGNQLNPQITPNGEGGAIIVWEDRRSANSNIYVQAVNHFGNTQWAADGLAITTSGGANPQITPDRAGGAIIVWEDYRTGNSDIYAQKIDSQGKIQWGANGVAVCNAANRQLSPQVITDGTGGAVIAWQDERLSPTTRIYFQWVYNDGTTQLAANGLPVTQNTSGSQIDPMLVYTGRPFYPAVISWSDSRSGSSWDIYAQSIDDSGDLLWGDGGVAVCTAAGDQKAYRMTYDSGSSSTTIVWEDYREGSDSMDSEVYTQRLNGSGKVAWAANGVRVSTAGFMQLEPDIAPNGASGAVTVWHELSAQGTLGLYAQSY